MTNTMASPHSYKRLIVWTIASTTMLQATVPAYATVSQLPALYAAPPDVNVMFTLDDSGSMRAEGIPDFAQSGITGMPTNSSSGFHGRGSQFPNMWGNGSSYLSTTYYRKSGGSAPAISRYMRSSAGNPLYYNPAITYLPWPDPTNNQSRLPNADPTAVNIHADDPRNSTRTLNLDARQGSGGNDNEANNFWLATWYVYSGPEMALSTPNDSNNIESRFTKYELKSTATNVLYPRAATRTDCSGTVGATGCTYLQERQNFANWLQYYRNRRLMAKGGVAAAFAKQGTNLRVGFATINSNVSTTTRTGGVVRRGVAPFSGTSRSGFFTDLYAWGEASSIQTPLRNAMDQVGRYFQRTGTGSPWAEDPTSNSAGTEYACRRSFHILSSDGFWNDAQAATSAARDNNDSFSGNAPPPPDSTTGSSFATLPFSRDPFRDSNSNTLADVAAYYWMTDLRPDLANVVAPSTRDPAYWQHVTTFTVGLGITGTGLVRPTSINSTTVPTNTATSSPFYPYRGKEWLSEQGLRDALISARTPITWTTPASENRATGDDLIHASMNGRGRYFSATNPDDLANGLSTALAEAVDQPIGLSSAAADSPQVAAGNRIYQATFSPSGWYGRLYAFGQNAISGAVDTTPSTAIWEASNRMDAPSLRNIFTMNVGTSTQTGALFNFAGLTSTQRANLCVPVAPATTCTGTSAEVTPVIEYLRGSAANEIANGGSFRNRPRYQVGAVTGGVLGDIVNGSPIKGPDAGGGYDRMATSAPEQSSYATFRSGTRLNNMRSTIFVSANDGMLHAFAMSNGAERFAFVPNAVFNVPRAQGNTAEQKLRMLTSPSYTHRFTVDGPPNVGDAYFGGGWKSVLVASHGAGARSVFAIDVTNPVVGDTNGFDTSKLLWEFPNPNNATDVADMGYVTGYPHVVRMRNGQWAAIFGNGYDSDSGRPALFVVNIETGALIRKIADFGTTGAVEAGGPRNGLSTPNFILNTNREVETIYAGDLSGALWKFDVSDTNPANWGVAFAGNAPLYRARTASNQIQPISVMPEIAAHPEGGAMIYFGTGKIFETEDTQNSSANMNLRTQTFYGIWDRPSQSTGISGRTLLQAQTAPSGTASFTATSQNSVNYTTQRGWYIDLASGGERVNVIPTKVRDVLFFIANTPVVDPCSTGGGARVFAVDPYSGGVPSFPVYDVDGNSVLNSLDNGLNVLRVTTGVLTQPIFQRTAGSTSSTTVEVTVSPSAPFDVGQASGGKQGGVELQRTAPTSASNRTQQDCAALLAAAKSNTDMLSQLVGICSPVTGRPRITWRQVR